MLNTLPAILQGLKRSRKTTFKNLQFHTTSEIYLQYRYRYIKQNDCETPILLRLRTIEMPYMKSY
jgi:hypothetical protein